MIGLIAVCAGIMILGAAVYLERIKEKLKASEIQGVMDITLQQRQAVENFISGDRERLHGYAEFFAGKTDVAKEEIQEELKLFENVDSVYAVICLDEDWFCSNAYADIRWIDEEKMDTYRSLSGSGVRDDFIGSFSQNLMFGFYETFTFQNGHRGLIQKTYLRSKVLETFSLSVYNGQGYGYILNEEGDILLGSVSMAGSRVYDNVFEALADTHNPQADIDAFRAYLEARETGSIVFTGDNGSYIYTFVPIDSVDGWYMLSIVPEGAIQDAANTILRDSWMAIGLFALILAISAVFIVLVRRTYREIEKEAMEIGIDHFPAKPFFMSSFKEAVKRIMDSKEKAKSIASDVVRDKHVLVADDIEVNRIILVKILGSLGAVCSGRRKRGEPGVRPHECVFYWTVYETVRRKRNLF